MAIRVVRLGSPREQKEGFRIGAVRRPPQCTQGGLCAAELLRCMAAGAGAKRAACVVAAVGTDHAEALASFLTPVPARDADARRSASCRIARCAIIANELFGGLLL